MSFGMRVNCFLVSLQAVKRGKIYDRQDKYQFIIPGWVSLDNLYQFTIPLKDRTNECQMNATLPEKNCDTYVILQRNTWYTHRLIHAYL